MAAKKEVMFREVAWAPVVGDSVTLLGVRGHYRLGDEPVVHTSYVVDVRDNGDTIETKNTIYKRTKD